ncbi:MAG TPA: hypothetical protein V6C63_02420 [Allocoleopsis sp.]
MNKLPCLTLTLWLGAIALIPTPSYSQPRSSIEPVSSKLQVTTDVPICYLQTSDGRIVDLSQTCGFVRPSLCRVSGTDPARMAALTSFCQQNQQCLLTETCDQAPQPQSPANSSGPVGSLTPDRLLSSARLFWNN